MTDICNLNRGNIRTTLLNMAVLLERPKLSPNRSTQAHRSGPAGQGLGFGCLGGHGFTTPKSSSYTLSGCNLSYHRFKQPTPPDQPIARIKSRSQALLAMILISSQIIGMDYLSYR